MNLFSILIADGPEGDPPAATLPPTVARNIDSFKAHHPDLAHRFFDRYAIRSFLAGSMEQDVLWAFDQLLPYAYKADLARLCLLHEFGGVYADLSVCFHGSWSVRPGKLSIFRDRAFFAPWIVSNTIIAAPPRFPAIEAAIRMIVANCRARYRGASALCPSGPVLFGKAIAMHCEPGQIHMGEVNNVSGRDSTESLVFVDATDGRLVGYRSKTRAGLSELGLHRGVNNYNDFYYAGVVYADDFPVIVPAAYLQQNGHTRCVLAGGELVYRSEETADAAGKLLVLGKFFPFAAGSYTILLDLSAIAAGSVVTLFATQGEGNREFSRAVLTARHNGAATLSLHFDLAASRNDIAIGVLAGPGAALSIKQLRIGRSSAPASAPAHAEAPAQA